MKQDTELWQTDGNMVYKLCESGGSRPCLEPGGGFEPILENQYHMQVHCTGPRGVSGADVRADALATRIAEMLNDDRYAFEQVIATDHFHFRRMLGRSTWSASNPDERAIEIWVPLTRGSHTLVDYTLMYRGLIQFGGADDLIRLISNLALG